MKEIQIGSEEREEKGRLIWNLEVPLGLERVHPLQLKRLVKEVQFLF